MPVQHTICGQPIRWQTPPRRFQLLFAIVLFVIATLSLYGTPTSSDLPSYESVVDAVKNPHVPDLDLPAVPRPFGPAAHKPQPNSNSSGLYGPIKWFADFKWREAFSSKTTVDENTSVLPPLKERPMIYTYYEPQAKQSKELSEAENRLVLAWRRAWWAQGFRPQVLSSAEAMRHPLYDLVQRLKLGTVDPQVETEILRWLAWGYKGGSGILADWLALPMAEYENPILGFLRKGEYPNLSRMDTLQNALFFGHEAAINEALKKAIGNELFKNTTANHDKIVDLKKDGGAMVNLLSKDDLKVESKSHGIAYYSKSTIKEQYASLANKLNNDTQVEGLDLLANLINSHLHLTFQNTFAEGITVVKPLPAHTTALMYEAIDLARNLTQCPSSPLPGTCPPNKTTCKPCNPKKAMKLQLAPTLTNLSGLQPDGKKGRLYTIGTVPHPYTLTSLHHQRDSIDAHFLQLSAGRDQWLQELTKELLPGEHPTADRVLYFKQIVAMAQSSPTSLWLTAERVTHADLDWIFGFTLPQISSPKPEATPINENSALMVFPRPEMPAPIEGVEQQEEKAIRIEEERLRRARDAIKSENKQWKEIVTTVEQRNPGDTEAWRFARAFSGRRRQERKSWEKQEKEWAGSEKKAGVHDKESGGSRWSDRL